MRKLLAATSAALLAISLMAGGASAAQAVTPAKSSISLKVTTTTHPTAGSYVKLTGTASRNLIKHRVTLQRRAGSSKTWRTITSSTLKSKAFSFKVRSTGVGKQYYRAIGAASTNVKKAVSSSRGITVFTYYYLEDQSVIDNDTWVDENAYSIGGTNYARSVAQHFYTDTATHYVTYNASYRCRAFVANVGIDDQSASSTAAFAYNIGGDDVALATVASGRSSRVVVDTSGVFRLTLRANGGQSTESYDVVWGNARLLCSGKP